MGKFEDCIKELNKDIEISEIVNNAFEKQLKNLDEAADIVSKEHNS